MALPTGSQSFYRRNPHLFSLPPEGRMKNEECRNEKQLHDEIEALCRARGWLYRHDRMDKPTTGQVGFPDFAIFMPGAVTVFLECKRPGGKATTAQLAKLAHARKLGFTAEIVTSLGEVAAAIVLANRRHEY